MAPTLDFCGCWGRISEKARCDVQINKQSKAKQSKAGQSTLSPFFPPPLCDGPAIPQIGPRVGQCPRLRSWCGPPRLEHYKDLACLCHQGHQRERFRKVRSTDLVFDMERARLTCSVDTSCTRTCRGCSTTIPRSSSSSCSQRIPRRRRS